MNLKKLVLRGAKGIPYDIDLDFTDTDGIIGIIGDNGIGKSTLEWQLMPYTIDILKGWNLKDRFFDSGYKYLAYEISDKLFECEFRMEKTPECSFRINGKEVNESLKQSLYEKEVEIFFLPLNLVAHTIYSIESSAANKGRAGELTSSLALLDPKKRKDFFIDLLDLNLYQKRNELSRAHQQGEKEKIRGFEYNISSAQDRLGSFGLLSKEEITKEKNGLLLIEQEIKDLNARKENNIIYEQYLISKNKTEEVELHINEYKELYEVDSIEQLKDYLNNLQNKLMDIGHVDIDHIVDEIKSLNKGSKDFKEAMDYRDKRLSIAAEVNIYIERGIELNKQLSVLKNTELLLLAEIDAAKGFGRLSDKLYRYSANVPCSEDLREHCQLYKISVGLQGSASSDNENKLKEVTAHQENLEKIIKDTRDNCRLLLDNLGIKHDELQSYISIMKTKNIEDMSGLKNNNLLILELQVSLDSVPRGQNIYQDVKDRISNVSNDISLWSHYNIVINEFEATEIIEGIYFTSEDKDRGSTLEKERISILARLESDKINRKAANIIEHDIRTLDKELNKCTKDEQEYALLSEAYSNNGIVALELDYLCPKIIEYANMLLEDTEYNMEIQTYKYINKGKKNETIKEIFDLIVYVNGKPRHYLELSAGQRVSPDIALSQAASQILSNKYNMNSLFIDERDGTLTPSRKIKFIDMLKKSHILSGRKNTFIISHDPAVWTACDWIICLNKDKYVFDKLSNINLEF